MIPADQLLLLDSNVLLHLTRGRTAALWIAERYGLHARQERPLVSVVSTGDTGFHDRLCGSAPNVIPREPPTDMSSEPMHGGDRGICRLRPHESQAVVRTPATDPSGAKVRIRTNVGAAPSG